ncbi:uncharacterized protein KY384_005397 [Bacidia gigantensis]|uniref:uncharacterized protein n=1 Tax=Bacidia gigantensis TaxID=2732470 RepID=UPI001D051760|nr:uncharacterized protein KY384_005397 [Bacidia gigantensis]KAG8529916.1 hypothetical protein KY384_005397 [Bacidia gigantensis]
MSALPKFREMLENAAIQGYGCHGQKCQFVPNSALDHIMTYEAIFRALQEIPSLEPHVIPAYTKHIESKAQKIFAILLLMNAERSIADFLQQDLGDAKLPLKFSADVDSSVLDTAGQRLFTEQQWRFLAPEFTVARSSISRIFPEETILPFTGQESLSKGSSGQISKIWIHPSHQDFLSDSRASGTQQCVFALKRIEPNRTHARERKAFTAETRSLSMLLKLRHSSIVQLLAAFSHGSTYNYIFPLADMDLESFLHRSPRHPEFTDDRSIFRAMAGVASALENIHDFVYREQDLHVSKIGFHHDLKPENILVRGRGFLITDFGLSRFCDKDALEKVGWVGGNETYAPPEVDPEFRDCGGGDVDSCAVDLWAFGCILIEVVVFMLGGPIGLDQFRDCRLTWYCRSRDDCFHRGKALKPEVVTVIERYRQMSSLGGSAAQSLDLACRLLNFEPSKRRDIQLAVETARIASNAQYCRASELLGKRNRNLDMRLHKAAAAGDVDEVSRLIQGGVSVMAKDENWRTALHWAALCNQGASLRQLYESTNAEDRERLNKERDSQGRTVLSLATQYANVVTVRTILEEASGQENLGDLVSQCDVFGMSPLHLACQARDYEIVRDLLEGIPDGKERFDNKMLKDDRGMTALHYAAQNPERETVLLLLADGGEVLNVQNGMAIRMVNDCNDDGLTPLMLAEENGCTYVASLLHDIAGADHAMDKIDPLRTGR